MAATASFTSSIFTPSSSASCGPSLKPLIKELGFKLGFMSSSSTTLKPLISRGVTTNNAPSSSNGRPTLSVRMVLVPSVVPTTSLDFKTSVFKKEKITLARHKEQHICERRERFVPFIARCIQGD